MSEAILAAVAMILFFPLVVLLVAITGPHSKYERYDQRRP